MIRILVDSASSITPTMAQSLGVHLIPLKVTFGEDTFLDGVNMDPPAFYQRLASDRALPITSQPSAGDFLELFRELTADGSELLCVLISHQLSGTLSSAEAARDMLPGRSIHIFNSLSASIGEGLMVKAALKMIQESQSIEAILARLERMRTQMRIHFVVDTLEFLQRGGRIGGAAALIGTLLKVKPLLTLENGRIEPLEKVRTKQKAVERMLALMEEHVDPTTPVLVGLAHGNSPDEAEQLLSVVRARFNVADVTMADVGPIISAHTGPGVLGLGLCPGE